MLDTQTRGILENIIDEAISNIPMNLSILRDVKKQFQIKEENDFTFGLAV